MGGQASLLDELGDFLPLACPIAYASNAAEAQRRFRALRIPGTQMGGGQNDGPLSGPLNTRCRVIITRTPKGTIVLATTQVQSIFPKSISGLLV